MTDEIPESIETIQADESKALRAEKTTETADDIDGETRTAVRYLGEDEFDEPRFQVVSTRTESFPEGVDYTETYGIQQVAHWAEANDTEVIDVADDDGFEDVDGFDDVDGGAMPA